MPNEGIRAVQWAPRIALEKIRRLYESEARGTLDQVLLDDVLIGLYLRCHSIMTATEAFYGRVECPCCQTIITHPPHNSDRNYVLQCPTCPWQVTWGEYHRSYQRKHLFWGGAFPAIWEYMDGFFSARTESDRLLLLDRLIHGFHWEMINFRGHPVATLVLDGSERAVFALLENLAYGEGSRPEIAARRDDWQKRRHRTDFAYATWKNASKEECERGSRESEAFAKRHRALLQQMLQQEL